jgi:hypothetical protein
MSLHLHPGPKDKSVLFMYNRHRAYHLFKSGASADEPMLTVRRGDNPFWTWYNNNSIHERVKQVLDNCGFGGVLDSGYRKVDSGLIEALVERWRPETNTFHLPVGEATVTLQDINILWGLPIEGGVVSGLEPKSDKQTRIDRIGSLLGATPANDSIKWNSLKLTWLMGVIKSGFPENPTDEQVVQRARCIMLYFCGGTLFPDANNSLVPLYWLNNLVDINEVGRLSWGSAALACLYRNLTKATHRSAKNIGGPMFILQIWAWTRISVFRPRLERNFEFQRTKPLAHM